MDQFRIGNRWIGGCHPPFIIAEMSGNHNQSLDRALHIVEAAAKAGAHALKLQTYTADTMTLDLHDGDFAIQDPDSPWKGMSLHKLYRHAHTPWEWHRPIFERCRELGMIGFSTPFDESAVDFLESLQVPLYKIASFENTDLPLIRKAASTGKPLIISAGMATAAELDEAVSAARTAGCRHIILLKCTSTYPSSPENSHLSTIPHMKELFNCPVGLSDHTPGFGAAIAGVALGASVIEKHFTLNRGDGGVDALFSLEPEEFGTLVSETQSAWQALGRIHYGVTEEEKPSLKFRRSIYVSQDIKSGQTLHQGNVRIIRPGYGLPSKYYDLVLGRKVIRDLAKGTPLQWAMME